MNNYVHFDKVQNELKKKDSDFDLINCFSAQLGITISLTIYIALLIVYMCLVVNPPKFVYILLGIVIFGNSLIASFSLMNIGRKKQSRRLWVTIYFVSICFVNAINVGLAFHIFALPAPIDMIEMYGEFIIVIPGFAFTGLSLIILFMMIFYCKWKTYYQHCLNDLDA